jgi:hypothetical protein
MSDLKSEAESVALDAGKAALSAAVKVVELDVESIFNRHRLNSLNDKAGTGPDHWLAALTEVLDLIGVKIVPPAPVVSEPAGEPLKSAAQIAVEKVAN